MFTRTAAKDQKRTPTISATAATTINPGGAAAAESLDEGLEGTLTLHRLGLAEELRLSFSTTNVIESIQAQIGRLTDHVDRFRASDQKHRWVGTALLEIEPRMRRVRGMKHLPMLRAALRRELGINKRQAAA